MKQFFFRKDLPSLVLLVSYLLYIVVHRNSTIADGIVVLALASVYAYQQYLIQKEQPNYDQKINELRSDMSKDLSKLRDDFAKFQMTGSKPLMDVKKIRF